jgi:mRNA interferase RelE/StbE
MTPRAAADLASLRRPVLRRVDARLLELPGEPRPHGCQKLRGGDGMWRLRVGDYRILYVVDERRRVITVARILHRSVAYR